MSKNLYHKYNLFDCLQHVPLTSDNFDLPLLLDTDLSNLRSLSDRMSFWNIISMQIDPSETSKLVPLFEFPKLQCLF